MKTTELALTENMFIDNNKAIDLAYAGLSMQKEAENGVAIICYINELIRDESGDYYIDTINYKPVEFAKIGELLVTDNILDEDWKLIIELFDK